MDDSALIAYVLFWIIGFGGISSMVASNKGLNGTSWFIIGGLFGIFGLLAAVVAQPGSESTRSTAPVTRDTRKCPYCAEFVKFEAVVCRFCGNDLEPITRRAILENRIDSLRQAQARGEGELEIVRELSDTKMWVHWRAGAKSALFSLEVLADGSLEQKRLS